MNPEEVTTAEETAVARNFGARIAEARANKGMSQRTLAAVLTDRGFPLDASAISRIESGSRNLRLYEALKISDALGVSLATLLPAVASVRDEGGWDAGYEAAMSKVRALTLGTPVVTPTPKPIAAPRQITRLLTLGETAEMLRRSESQLRWMITAGKAPQSSKIMGRIMFREPDVLAFIERAFEKGDES